MKIISYEVSEMLMLMLMVRSIIIIPVLFLLRYHVTLSTPLNIVQEEGMLSKYYELS